jgi:3D-(3,5/4)-trihydroxycyclohexane-1,2-dione acylhydrolase (decyclizing)
MMGAKLIVTVLDNRGYGCINRLQQACGGAPFNNLIDTVDVAFAAHAASLGAISEQVTGIAASEQALARARRADRTCVIVVATDPGSTTEAGGAWWDVAVPQVSKRAEGGRAGFLPPGARDPGIRLSPNRRGTTA